MVAPDIGDERPERAEIARPDRNENSRHFQFIGDRACVHRTRAPESNEREIAWIVTVSDRDVLDRADHAHDRDVQDAFRQRIWIHAPELAAKIANCIK